MLEQASTTIDNYEFTFSTILALDLLGTESSHGGFRHGTAVSPYVMLSIESQSVRTGAKSKVLNDAMWDERLQLVVAAEVISNGSLVATLVDEKSNKTIGEGQTALSALLAARKRTKQLTIELNNGAALAMSVDVSAFGGEDKKQEVSNIAPSPEAKDVVVLPNKERQDLEELDDECSESTYQTGGDTWPVADAFVRSSVERYVEECEKAGVKRSLLKMYREYLQSSEAKAAAKASLGFVEGFSPMPPIVAKTMDKAAAEYAVSKALEGNAVSVNNETSSPRLYAALRRCFEEAVVNSSKADFMAPLSVDATYPWERRFDEHSGLPYWVDVDGGASRWDEPKRVWERKLEMLERVKRAGHVSRRVERTKNVVDPPGGAADLLLRQERRLDAVPDGWEWEEDEREARRRRYAKRTRQQALTAARERRGREPTDIEAIADTVVSLVAHVCRRASLEAARYERRRVRLERISWHPACGARHMARLETSHNFVRHPYVDCYFTSIGDVWPAPLKISLPKQASTKRLPSIFRWKKPPKFSNPGLVLGPSSINFASKASVHPHDREKPLQAATVRVELQLCVLLPPAYKVLATKDSERPRLDTRERQAFESALTADVALAAGIATSHVLLEELTTVRRMRAIVDCAKIDNKRPWESESAIIYKRKRALGWTADAQNLAAAKLLLVIGDENRADAIGRAVVDAAADEHSLFRRRGAVSCCAHGRSTYVVISEKKHRSWEQYWAHMVSPVFWGRDPRTFDVAVKPRCTNEEVSGSDREDDDRGPECLAPVQYAAKSGLARLRRALIEAEQEMTKVNEGKPRYDARGVVIMTPEQHRVSRKMERAMRSFNLQSAKYRRRLHRSEPPEWWQRPKISPHHTFDAATLVKIHKSATKMSFRDLAKKRAAKLQAHQQRVRSKAWRARKWAAQCWLVEKLAKSVNVESDKYYAAINAAEAETRVASTVRPANDALPSGEAQQLHLCDVESSLRALHRELSEDLCSGEHVAKRHILSNVACRPDELRDDPALGPLVTTPCFAAAFLKAPVESPGYVTADELAAFGLAVVKVYPLYNRALDVLKPSMDEEAAAQAQAQGDRVDVGQLSAQGEDEKGEEDAYVAHESNSPLPVERWHGSHSHIYVRSPFHNRGAYCCICRRRREEERSECRANVEAAWTRDGFAEFVERKLHGLVPTVAECVDARRAAERAIACERAQIVACLRDVIDHVVVVFETVSALVSTVEASPSGGVLRQELNTRSVTLPKRASFQGAAKCALFSALAAEAVKDRDDEIQAALKERKAVYEREESERRLFACEEAYERERLDAVERAVEEPLEIEQRKGKERLELVLSCLVAQDRCPDDLARLRWIETISNNVDICQDPANGMRVTLRLLWLQHRSDVDITLERALELKFHASTARNGLVNILAVHDMRLDSFNLHGTCYSIVWLVVIVTRAIDGPRLRDALVKLPPPPNLSETTTRKIEMYTRQLRRATLQIEGVDVIRFQRWLQQLATTLAGLHRANILHRNLRPDSVFLDKDRPIIDDFLLLNDAPRPPHCPYSLGRLDYLGQPNLTPPEISQGVKVTAAADIWAFGCCIYTWLAGKPPLALTQADSSPHSYAESLERLLRGLPTPFVNGPVALALRLSLQPDPAVRATASQLAMLLKSGLSKRRPAMT